MAVTKVRSLMWRGFGVRTHTVSDEKLRGENKIPLRKDIFFDTGIPSAVRAFAQLKSHFPDLQSSNISDIVNDHSRWQWVLAVGYTGLKWLYLIREKKIANEQEIDLNALEQAFRQESNIDELKDIGFRLRTGEKYTTKNVVKAIAGRLADPDAQIFDSKYDEGSNVEEEAFKNLSAEEITRLVSWRLPDAFEEKLMRHPNCSPNSFAAILLAVSKSLKVIDQEESGHYAEGQVPASYPNRENAYVLGTVWVVDSSEEVHYEYSEDDLSKIKGMHALLYLKNHDFRRAVEQIIGEKNKDLARCLNIV